MQMPCACVRSYVCVLSHSSHSSFPKQNKIALAVSLVVTWELDRVTEASLNRCTVVYRYTRQRLSCSFDRTVLPSREQCHVTAFFLRLQDESERKSQ